MTLYEAMSKDSISSLKVKLTDFTCETSSGFKYVGFLLSYEAWVTFPYPMQFENYGSFLCTFFLSTVHIGELIQ